MWLQAKLVLVPALSGLHGVLSGALRRSLSATSEQAAARPLMGAVVPLALVAIAMLAVMKTVTAIRS